MGFGAEQRARFAIAPDLTLLNHGSFGSCPREVLASQDRWRLAMEADPIAFMEAAPGRLRDAIGKIAPVLGARADDLVFVENASEGVNTVLRSLVLRPGDRLVTTSHVYGAVRNTLHWVASRAGATVEEIAVPWPLEDASQVVAAVASRVAGARLAVIDHITSPTGVVWPIAELVRACHDVGVPVLVDAAHAPGQVPMDLDAVGADYTTGNLHKWLFEPKGAAVLHVRRDRRDGLVPLVISHLVGLGFPRAWDQTATRDLSAWLAAPDALRFVRALGLDEVRAHNDALCAAMADELAAAWGVTLPSPRALRASMAAISAPRALPADRAAWLHGELQRRRIEVPCVPFAGRTWVRISAQVYNHPDEYRRLARAVTELVG